MRLIFKTSSVTPDVFYVFNLILSFSTCSESFEKICAWELLGANVLKLTPREKIELELSIFQLKRDAGYALVKNTITRAFSINNIIIIIITIIIIINFIYLASISLTVLGALQYHALQYHEKCITTTLTKKL